MSKYTYIVSGEYGDWLEMYKSNILIHSGNISVFRNAKSLLLDLNYGTRYTSTSVIKTSNEFIVNVPIIPQMLSDKYLYQTLIFERQEFMDFVLHTYYSLEKPLKELENVTKADIVNIWLLSYPNHMNFSNRCDMMNTILQSVLYVADDNYDITDIEYILSQPNLSVRKIDGVHNEITIYIETDLQVVEWDCLISISDKLYFRLDYNYYVAY